MGVEGGTQFKWGGVSEGKVKVLAGSGICKGEKLEMHRPL